MSSSLTSSFASAAAGGTSTNNNRREVTNGNDWSRSRPNSTTTFRRTSTQSRDNLSSALPTSAGAYVPPHLNPNHPFRNGTTLDTISSDRRYTKDELLNIYSTQRDRGFINTNLSKYFTGGWNPVAAENGSADSKDSRPEVCWNARATSEVLGMRPLTEEEKELFSTSVNSPIKMNNPKDVTGQTLGTRKVSNSITTGSGRPATRRRETSESFMANGPLSPTENKSFPRNDLPANTPPPALLRRRTDYQDELDRDINKDVASSNSPIIDSKQGTASSSGSVFNAHSVETRSGFSSLGAFGAFGTDSGNHDPVMQRPGLGSGRSTSRFKDIMNTNKNEELAREMHEKKSFTGLEKLEEEPSLNRDMIKNRPGRSETNPYESGFRSGSATGQDDKDPNIEQMGFSAFGNAQTPHHTRMNESMSPTNTNPFQSPQTSRLPHDEDETRESQGLASFGNARDAFSGLDSRPAGFGSMRGLSGLGNMGQMNGIRGGWGNAVPFGAGTPTHDRPNVSAAFGSTVFTPLHEIQSPGFGGNSFFGGSAGYGGLGSRQQTGLSGMFPPPMQDQMRSDSRNGAFEARPESFGLGGPRRQESFRSAFDNMRAPAESSFPHEALEHHRVTPPQPSASADLNDVHDASDTDSLPAAQQRQMVMPDRMRWVYRDPNGKVQGPWSGLEMHDWFKAGFFTAELQVKKVEDQDYEPLAQLVRRIGNSREPFLVPQIGVPHGPAPLNQASSPWAAAGSAAPSAGPNSAQPPFASSFPSFGTTLTAEQQNALERRKQEEQYLMAQQKEFLSRRQIYMQSGNGGPGSHSLAHQQSAHSLHSQPSFGSINNPQGFSQHQHVPPIQPPHHGFQNIPSNHMPANMLGLNDFDSQFGRMSVHDRPQFAPMGPGGPQPFAMHERNRLAEQEAQMHHENTFLGQEGHNERLQEFKELRDDMDDEHVSASADSPSMPAPIGSQRPVEDTVVAQVPLVPTGHSATSSVEASSPPPAKIQKASTLKDQEKSAAQVVEPPRVSTTPLPAPKAQRGGPSVAETFNFETRSAVQTPIETPGTAAASLAPWASREVEHARGPSLKEIQEAEAKKAAQLEAVRQAEIRKAQAEEERLATLAVSASVAPAPGLPTTSTWATSGSAAPPSVVAASPWAKPTTAKLPAKPAAKTLAQIQKEEEARKLKVAAQAATQAQATAYTSAVVAPTGSRYAQMAGKVVPAAATQSASSGSSAWTTVGQGGSKPKLPSTVVASAQPQRPASASTTVPARPTAATRASSIVDQNKIKARDELVKWIKSQLTFGLRNDVNVDEFTRTLFALPAEPDILAEAIYGTSETLDGRRIANEFLRRRRLAEKGVIEPVEVASGAQGTSTTTSNGGWSEVAKKSTVSAKEPETSAFKVVSKKSKKGTK